MSLSHKSKDSIEIARNKWHDASEKVSQMASQLFQPNSGYGDPDARLADEHRLCSAKEEAERLYREYNDLHRNRIDDELIKLQRSQKMATWASFSVAAVVGIATIVQIVMNVVLRWPQN